MKVAIIYRVVQGWRTPVFEKLKDENEFKLFYGCDFEGTKVISSKGPYSFESKRLFSIPIALKKKAGNMLLPFSPFLLFELIKYNPDVVLCEGASNFLNNISVFVYCKLFGKSMVQWGLGEIRGRKKSAFRKILEPLIVPIEKRADAIVSYSSIGAKYYEDIGVDKKNIFIAVNVVDTEKRLNEIKEFHESGKQQLVAGDNKFKVLFVGAIEPNKNIEMLIKAFCKLYRTFPDTELHIVGSGSHIGVLERIVIEEKIAEAVTFHGRVEGPLVNIVFDKDVFVMPGLGGLAVSDMLCHGIPVICSVGDGCELDLINEFNGIVDDELNEELLLKYLTMLKSSPGLLNEMKESAKKTVLTHNIDNYVKQINAALKHAVKEKHV